MPRIGMAVTGKGMTQGPSLQGTNGDTLERLFTHPPSYMCV